MRKILRAFKNLFLKKEDRPVTKPVYLCEPKINFECTKDGCWYGPEHGPCKCTLKKNCAKVDAEGNPIRAKDEDLYNLEWMERAILHDPPGEK